MFLEKLEIQGFKTFAQKVLLEFLPPRGGKRGVTGIVGPNGSGKSNLADAVRWVLGEQSLKLLRGKKSEDVIFSGTDKRARSGFAEVTLTLNNEDHSAPIDLSTVAIARRLYRSGESEYLINGKVIRLADIQMLLAQSNFGQRTYSVIGQGMVDHVLVASPQERKEFFDEAAGVKQFEIKRNQAMNKLSATHENLRQARGLLGEIEPRLRSLSRQIKRLEQRGPLEQELRDLGRAYYGTLWTELGTQLKEWRGRANEIETKRTKKSQELDALRKELQVMESEETKAAGFLELQKEYEVMIQERGKLRDELLKTQNAITLAKLQAAKPDAFPVGRVLQELESMTKRQETLVTKLDAITSMHELAPLRDELRAITKGSRSLLTDLTSSNRTEPDAKLVAEQKRLETALTALELKLAAIQERIRGYASEEREKKGKFFAIQRTWETKQAELGMIEREANDIKVELARIETRREALIHEVQLEMNQSPEQALTGELPPLTISREGAAEQLRRLKMQLETIGSIDPETVKEHDETKERHDFLKTHIDDLEKAVLDLESGIADLDHIIEERAEIAFKKINEGFDQYFKQLFGGGHATLMKIEAEEDEDEEIEGLRDGEMESKDVKPQQKKYNGIDIQATPPGKRLKAINMLSGGERALTSIALICAIMAANPSPFVVLDEVDAALDESNSIRFAEIVDELAARTQFIVITHNRATMHIAQVLYGVTMSDDGASRLLSLKLEEAEAIRNAPRVEM